MKNKNIISKDRCKELIQYAQTLLNMSLCELDVEYKKLPPPMGDDPLESLVEIRLDKEETTVTCSINEQRQCTDVYFFFDKKEDESTFSNYLIDCLDYPFEKRVWLSTKCVIRTCKIKDILTFHFYKQSKISQIRAKYLFSFFNKKINPPLVFNENLHL